MKRPTRIPHTIGEAVDGRESLSRERLREGDEGPSYFFLSFFSGLQSFFFESEVAPHDLHLNLPGRSHSFGLSSRQPTAELGGIRGGTRPALRLAVGRMP